MKNVKNILIIIVTILLVATIFIGIGLYLNSLSKPKYIFSKSIDMIKNRLDDYVKISKDLNLEDNYNIEGNIKFDLDSEYYKNDVKTNNLINNLNRLNTSFKIQKNKSKNMAYLELKELLDKEELLNASYYIADSTKYYYVNNIVDNYINDGGCNYFESINNSNTGKDNIDYLYNFIIKSIKNNLDDKYFTTKEKKDSYIASVKLNNTNLNNIINGVLTDLKKDKRSRNILDNVDKRILNTKFNNKDILEKDEYYKIDIYTTKILHKPTKIKIEHTIKNDSKTYIYDGNENKKTLYYIENSITKYIINLSLSNKEIAAIINDSDNTKIGEFKIERDNHNTTINLNFDDEINKIDLIYSSKYSNIKNNKSFTNEKKLAFKYIVNKETRLNGDINLKLKMKKNPNILVDIQNAKLRTNLTEEEKEKLNNLEKNIKNRLES